jgi:hypothetical protein
MESAIGCLWILTVGAIIRLTAPLLRWRKQLYFRQIPVVYFALLLVEAEARPDAALRSLFQLQEDTREQGAFI